MIATSPATLTWRGTALERSALEQAVSCYCTGPDGRDGDRCRPGDWRSRMGEQHVCAAHQMLRDQRILDHLLFARRIRLRLLAEELDAYGTLAREARAVETSRT